MRLAKKVILRNPFKNVPYSIIQWHLKGQPACSRLSLYTDTNISQKQMPKKPCLAEMPLILPSEVQFLNQK